MDSVLSLKWIRVKKAGANALVYVTESREFEIFDR